jgi:hypothetical protein
MEHHDGSVFEFIVRLVKTGAREGIGSHGYWIGHRRFHGEREQKKKKEK